MIIKIDQELSPDKILKAVQDLLRRNQPIGEDKALSITITSIVDAQETKKIDVK